MNQRHEPLHRIIILVVITMRLLLFYLYFIPSACDEGRFWPCLQGLYSQGWVTFVRSVVITVVLTFSDAISLVYLSAFLVKVMIYIFAFVFKWNVPILIPDIVGFVLHLLILTCGFLDFSLLKNTWRLIKRAIDNFNEVCEELKLWFRSQSQRERDFRVKTREEGSMVGESLRKLSGQDSRFKKKPGPQGYNPIPSQNSEAEMQRYFQGTPRDADITTFLDPPNEENIQGPINLKDGFRAPTPLRTSNQH